MPYQSLGMMQQQRQVQTLAPQMRQSLEILQLPMMELRALIQHEMEQNPVIEDVTSAQELVVDTMADSSPDLERMAKTALEDSRRDHDEAVASDDGDDLLGEAPAPGKDAGNAQLDFDKDTLRDIGSDDAGYLFDDDQVSQPFTKEAQERRQYMFDSLTQTVSLQQHLLDQLVASDLSLEDKQIGEMIIGGLNDDGFLTVSLDDLADQTAFPKERIEHVLRVVQTFDPPGIAARDGRECLLLQLEGLDTPGADLARAIVSRYLKALDPDCVTVFIGPCIAKKGETLNEYIADRPDFALTYGEIVALLDSKDIEITPVPEDYQEASIYGKRFAGSGGVAKAVLRAMEEMGEDTSDISLLTCAGGDECKKALMLLKAGKLKEDFIEGMMCPGGCVGGPSKHQVETVVERDRKGLLAAADGRGILENLKKYPMDKFSMFRDGH